MTFHRTLTFAALCAALPACLIGEVGSGESATEVRSAEGVDDVINHTFLSVDILPGEAGEGQEVSVTCDDNLVDEILTEIDEGVLSIRTPVGANLLPRSECRAEVRVDVLTAVESTGSGGVNVVGDAPDLEVISSSGSGGVSVEGAVGALRVVSSSGSGGIEIGAAQSPDCVAEVSNSGSGRITIGDLEACELAVGLSGSGRATISGRVRTLSLDVSGSGGARNEDLVAEEADIRVRGSGGVELTVTERVSVNLSGSGGAVIHGDPADRDVTETGSGRVRFE